MYLFCECGYNFEDAGFSQHQENNNKKLLNWIRGQTNQTRMTNNCNEISYCTGNEHKTGPMIPSLKFHTNSTSKVSVNCCDFCYMMQFIKGETAMVAD